MNEKTLKMLLGVLAGLVVVYAIVALASRGPAAGAEAGPLAGSVGAVDAAAVGTVTMTRRGETVTLERTDEGWTVDGRPADTAKVAELWTALEEAGAAELIAANPDNHERLGVADGDAWTIAFDGDGEPVRLLVGDAAASGSGAYLRLPDSDEVYQANGGLRGLVSRGVDDWRDRRIVAVDTAAVAEVRVAGDDGYTLRREDGGGEGAGGWTIDGEPADAATVRDLLGALARLEATGFAPDSVELNDPDRTVTALAAAGDTLAALRMRTTEAGDVRVAVPGRDAVFELAGWRADRLAPERDGVVPDDASS